MPLISTAQPQGKYYLLTPKIQIIICMHDNELSHTFIVSTRTQFKLHVYSS